MPKKRPWRLAELTLKEVRKTKFQAAMLPFGATEPHNLHLPYGTDIYEAQEVGDRACAWAWKKGARVALLPPLPFGANQNLLEFPMTISMDQEQLDGIVASVAKSLEHHGVMKLVVLNSHGGNDFRPGLRTLYGKTRVFTCLIDWWVTMEDVAQKLFECPGEHADEMETCFLLAKHPHLVHMDWADDGGTYPARFEAGRKGWVWFPRAWERVTKNSGYGDPRKSTAEKGHKYLKAIEKRLGKFLIELAEMKIDKSFPFDRKKKAK